MTRTTIGSHRTHITHAYTRVKNALPHTRQHAHRDCTGCPADVRCFLFACGFSDDLDGTLSSTVGPGTTPKYTHAHVYTTADREFIFYGELDRSFREELAAPRRSRSRYDKYLNRDRPLNFNCERRAVRREINDAQRY